MTAYFRPQTLDEALADPRRATGDDPRRRHRRLSGQGGARRLGRHAPRRTCSTSPPSPACAASSRTQASWRIGALTTWTDLIRAELPPLFAGLKLAAREVGGVQIQNRGTLVGNICTASPAGDGMPNLLALDAEVELASRKRPPRRADRAISSTAIATRSAAPTRSSRRSSSRSRRAAARSHFLKLGARRYLVISIVMVAGVIETRCGRHASRTRASPSAPARPCRSACRRWRRRWSAQPLADAADLVAAGASRATRADRRHPRLGRLPPAGGADADARSAGASLPADARAEGRLMQDRAAHRRRLRHRLASR